MDEFDEYTAELLRRKNNAALVFRVAIAAVFVVLFVGAVG